MLQETIGEIVYDKNAGRRGDRRTIRDRATVRSGSAAGVVTTPGMVIGRTT